jgi:plastocyanin
VRGPAVAGPIARLIVVSVLLAIVVGCSAAAPTSPGSAATVDVTIRTASGETTAFDPSETVLAASGPISVTFQNASSLPHNLTFLRITAATRTIVEPGTSDELLVAPLAEGSYPFVCTIHEGMAGVLTVRAP